MASIPTRSRLFLVCEPMHALCSQVRCRQSLSSKIFQSSQSVMKEQSTSLSASWKVITGTAADEVNSTDVGFNLNPAPVPMSQVGLSLPKLGGFAVGGSHSKSSKFAEGHSNSDKFSFTTHDLNCKYYT